MSLRIAALCGVLLVTGAVGAVSMQETGASLPRLVPRSVAGEDLFRFYCATCHGRDGKGNGPVASALRSQPPDLTRLVRQHGGQFPQQRVEACIAYDGTGRMASHGSSEMPVWGPIFRGLESSDVLTEVRVANLVRYIESIQAK
jgi:mono/diheme cytochrome c family protein